MDIKMLAELFEQYGKVQVFSGQEKYRELFREIMFDWNTIADIDFEKLSEEAILYMLDNFLALSSEITEDYEEVSQIDLEPIIAEIRNLVSPRKNRLL